MRIKHIVIGSLISTSLFGIELDLYSKDFVKYKGIDVLNFYIPVKEKNKFRTYMEYEKIKTLDTITWNIGEGYIELEKSKELEYDIEKKFYKGNSNYKGWNNNFAYVKEEKETYFFKKNWDTNFIFGLEQESLENTPTTLERYKIYCGYRLRTPLNIGMGGTYFGFDILGKKVFSTIKDGFSGELNLISSTNLGYGFQIFNTIYNEYIYYDNNEGYRLGLESYLRWTYELSMNFAFAFEIGIDSDKYFGTTNLKYSNEVYFLPYILYSYNFTERFRVFSELGLLGYKIKKNKEKLSKINENSFYYYGKIGFEYIF